MVPHVITTHIAFTRLYFLPPAAIVAAYTAAFIISLGMSGSLRADAMVKTAKSSLVASA